MTNTVLTEEDIEITVCNCVNTLDRHFLTTNMTEENYKTELNKIDQWAEKAYKLLQIKNT